MYSFDKPMTIHEAPQFNIKSIAIIGAGPSGIASLYDLSRSKKDGTSLFGVTDISKNEEAGEMAFDEIVAFERNATVGGVWSKSAFGKNNKDPDLPLEVSNHNDDKQDQLVDTIRPDVIYKKFEIDQKLEDKLNSSSLEKPVSIPFDDKLKTYFQHQWRSSAAYEGLFTNVTNRYMRFSFHEKTDELKEVNTKYKYLPNLQFASDVGEYLEDAVKTNNLSKYIRFNTNVERVRKLDGKWEVVVSFVSEVDGVNYLNWYKQYFDAVIVGNGKTLPVVPYIKGLKEYSSNHKVKLAKSIQDPRFIKESNKILFIGASVSSIDLIQYCFPRDIDNPSVFISRRTPKAHLDWLTTAGYSKGIINKPTITKFENDEVHFADGTVEKGFDTVIIACGYHMYYPFLETQNHQWFEYTFSTDDPSLALVGNTYAGFFFNRVESQAAALSSVWSNNSKLPSKAEQLAIIENKPPLFTGNIKQYFIDPLMKYALKGRPHPFAVNPDKSDHVFHMVEGSLTIQGLFYKIRNGEVDPFNIT
ncbi:hypothetical protein CANINC_002686 [Pichia inconspicua]|uniref:FAD/NAD(P)-binding domain-containing protein n=1 Tax=Pichia inconspicua TaxID=52247 RepID=A0A4T0X109_9ASCO|nr:hypothetical protein CANINC_002686 [[Candida] inconspicua]